MEVLLSHDRDFLLKSLEILNSTNFQEYIIPLIEDRIDYWKDKIAFEDNGDVERRGIVKGLLWITGLRELVSSAIKSNFRK